MTIGEEDVSLAEFERIYRKNNNENSLNRQSPEEYLDLFINFRLKVMEAEAMGMDTTTKFKEELAGYREQLAKPYLADEATKEEMMREAYERSKEDINASHILIKMSANPTPEDTLAVYEKMVEIRERILGGESFESVARATSDDGSVSRNGGNLGYFTAFSMIYPFETMAYNTPVGEVSMPFRTSYGYHILQVHDRRPARGKIKVAHIFIRSPEDMPAEEKARAAEQAQMVYDSLMLGTDFGTMAQTYSQDPNTAKRGGEIPWFGTGRMIPEFENAAFGIEEIGGICAPVQSTYGWHIIKLQDKQGIGSYEEMKPDLQEKANRGDRMAQQTKRYVAKLKADYNFSMDSAQADRIKTNIDTTLLYATWDGAGLENDPTPLFTIEEKVYTVGDFVGFVLEKQALNKGRVPENYLNDLLERYTKEEIIAYEDSQLPEKYPEFRYIYEEYHDGILLFDIMDQQVWSKAVNDTTGLEAFHQAHRTDYMWGARTEALLFTCTGGTDLEGLKKASKKIARGKLDLETLNSTFCSNDTVDCISWEQVLVEQGENERVDATGGQSGMGDVSQEEDGSSSFVIVTGKRGPEPKELNEARGQITSDYQNYLETEWLKELKAKYPVEVNRELLARIEN
jgi:peptidyl-prolyl cis-trans isomerase SurA